MRPAPPANDNRRLIFVTDLRVDLEPIEFAYRPSAFRVVDNGHTVQVEVSGSSISLLGKTLRTQPSSIFTVLLRNA
jgi:hypothetical protein